MPLPFIVLFVFAIIYKPVGTLRALTGGKNEAQRPGRPKSEHNARKGA